jgi:hypothetical protein
MDQFLREALEAAVLAPAAAAVEADLRLALFAAEAAAAAVSSDSGAEAAAAAQGGQAVADAAAEARWVVQLATLPPLRLGISTLDIRSAYRTVVITNGQNDCLAHTNCRCCSASQLDGMSHACALQMTCVPKWKDALLTSSERPASLTASMHRCGQAVAGGGADAAAARQRGGRAAGRAAAAGSGLAGRKQVRPARGAATAALHWSGRR